MPLHVLGINHHSASLEIREKLAFPHTEIVPARRNQGFGHQLVKGALDDVRRKGAKVVPYCWFVAEFIEENPEYADLRA